MDVRLVYGLRDYEAPWFFVMVLVAGGHIPLIVYMLILGSVMATKTILSAPQKIVVIMFFIAICIYFASMKMFAVPVFTIPIIFLLRGVSHEVEDIADFKYRSWLRFFVYFGVMILGLFIWIKEEDKLVAIFNGLLHF